MNRYSKSQAFLQRAEKVIPLGSQTFSKSKVHFPEGVSPYFLTHGKGSHVWDVDGNEYVDFSCSLAALTLGYQDFDVDTAVKKQMEQGVSFSLSHPIETYVAEKLVEVIPCADMIRFGKNGSDATAGAVRLARAYTKRDHVLVCGYHGWQDWYIGSTPRDLGVPEATKALTHKFIYNDIESLHQRFKEYPNQVAAVILEPMTGNGPENDFLQKVKELTHQHGALLIFDEVVTGFRLALGGAQEYFGVTPDLSSFGKGLANGYPISVIAGRGDVMKLMEEIFFSFTFGGEALSLAASLAVLEKMQTQPVIEALASQGKKILEGVRVLIKKHEIADFMGIGGFAAQSGLSIKDTADYTQYEIRTLFLQEVFARGVLCIGIHNMCYAHDDKDIEKLLHTYDEVFGILHDAVHHKNLEKHLRCKPLVPLFKVR